MLPLWARVKQGVMAIKEYSAIPQTPGLQEPHHQIVCQFWDTHWEGRSLTLLQRRNWCIVLPEPTGQPNKIVCV